MNEFRNLKLHIVLRTCDRVSAVHPGPARICGGIPKHELITRCVKSLLVSMRRLSNNVDTRLTVIDDHSSQELLNWLKAEIPTGSQIIPVSDPGGNGKSMAVAYESGALIDSDVVYFVEDDYIHSPDTLGEMIDAMITFRKNLGGELEVAIAPTDDMWDYKPSDIKPSRIVLGARRHWRTNDHTCFTVMLSRYTVIHYWKLFEAFSHYGEPDISEDSTINLMYRGGGVSLFTPLPGLAIHMNADKVILNDWLPWWYPNIKKVSLDTILQLYPDKNTSTPPKMKWQESEELQVLRTLVNHFNVERMLEIGVNTGNTAGYLLKECSCIKRYLGVDITTDDLSYLPQHQQQEIKTLQPDVGKNAKDDPRFELQLYSNGSKGIDINQKFDLILIDGNHSKDWAEHDTQLAGKLIDGPGIIVWHDYGTEPGVTPVVGNSGLPVLAIGNLRMAVSIGVSSNA